MPIWKGVFCRRSKEANSYCRALALLAGSYGSKSLHGVQKTALCQKVGDVLSRTKVRVLEFRESMVAMGICRRKPGVQVFTKGG